MFGGGNEHETKVKVPERGTVDNGAPTSEGRKEKVLPSVRRYATPLGAVGLGLEVGLNATGGGVGVVTFVVAVSVGGGRAVGV